MNRVWLTSWALNCTSRTLMVARRLRPLGRKGDRP